MRTFSPPGSMHIMLFQNGNIIVITRCTFQPLISLVPLDNCLGYTKILPGISPHDNLIQAIVQLEHALTSFQCSHPLVTETTALTSPSKSNLPQELGKLRHTFQCALGHCVIPESVKILSNQPVPPVTRAPHKPPHGSPPKYQLTAPSNIVQSPPYIRSPLPVTTVPTSYSSYYSILF